MKSDLLRPCPQAHHGGMSAFLAQPFVVDGVTLTPLVGGADRLRALLGLIARAKRSLRLLYYIFDEDDVGRQVRDALLEALARGVNVSLTIDGFGSSASDAFLAPLEDAGGSICRFQPRLGRRYLLRNHQKMALADESCAIIGGFNISDPYFDDESADRWRDLGLAVEGSAAGRLAAYYDVLADWSRQPRAPMRDMRRALARSSEPQGAVRWLMGGPTRWLNPWLKSVRHDMGIARRVDMIAAYFVPNPAMLRRIEAIAKRGVANLMTAAKSDSDIPIAAARHSYHRLLKRGVKIWEYRACRLHTKLLVLDDVVYIGSANFDMRSLFLNFELMLRIEDPAFADHMRTYAEYERKSAQRIDRRLHCRRRTWFARLRWSLAYFIVGVLDSRLTRRLNFGFRWR